MTPHEIFQAYYDAVARGTSPTFAKVQAICRLIRNSHDPRELWVRVSYDAHADRIGRECAKVF